MRIISGKYKGRIISPPGNLPVRPTTDFAKTGLFNILDSRFDFPELNCLDLCSGTGSISIEMISRGAKSVTSVDNSSGCIQFLKKMCVNLNISNLNLLRSDVIRFLEQSVTTYDLIFADPPFDLDIRKQLHEIIFSRSLLNTGGVLILEHGSKESYQDLSGFNFSRQYGNVTFSFFFNLEQNI